jgi:hypothetical protein
LDVEQAHPRDLRHGSKEGRLLRHFRAACRRFFGAEQPALEIEFRCIGDLFFAFNGATLSGYVVQRTKGVASPRLALVTDHMAIVTGQARQDSHLGRFSRNPYLNALFSAMHRHRIRAWFVPGVNNPADGPSRCPGAGPRILAIAVNGFEGLALASLDRTRG